MRYPNWQFFIATVRQSDDYETQAWAAAEALYWWLADHHEGQWSDEYRALCRSPFQPSPMANGPEPDSLAEELYSILCN